MQLETPTIETKRLILREIRPTDIPILLEKFSPSELQSYLDLDTEAALQSEIFKLKGATHSMRFSFKLWYMIEKKSNRVIGYLAYHIWYLQHHKAEIGYGLRREEDKRKGYMSEALAVVLDYGFNNMNLQRIEAYVDPDNIASLQSVRKFGFQREGFFRKHFHDRHTQQVGDSVALALFPTDYQVLKKETLALADVVRLFEQRNLPTKYWTHEAHLMIAVWYLSQYSKFEATCLLRSGVIAYNIASGGANTPTSGYHETITLFWIEIIDIFLKEIKEELSVEEKIQQFLASPWSGKNILFEFYKKEELMSTQARAVWVAPSLKSL